MELRRIDRRDRDNIDSFIMSRWYTMKMVVHGEVFDLGAADGWYALEGELITGLVTYCLSGDEMEILSLDSLGEGRGVGTALLNRAVRDAAEAGAGRIILTTTNDNLHALRFYQKRGFDIVAIRRGALDEARKIKPEIPLVGIDGIPLKHEIELELLL